MPGKGAESVQDASGTKPIARSKSLASEPLKKEDPVPKDSSLNQSTELKSSKKNYPQPELKEDPASKPKNDAESKQSEEPKSNEKKVDEALVPKNKLSDVLKVIRLANSADEKQKDVALATLKMTEVRTFSLEQIRPKVKSIDELDTFCFKDLAPAESSLILEDYLHQSFDDVDFNAKHKPAKPAKHGEEAVEVEHESVLHKGILYLTPKPIVKAATTAKTLALDKFAIKVFEWSAGEAAGESGASSRGNLHSSKLETNTASSMTLAGLRKKLATCTKMSLASKTHQFCTKSGETVVDESMTFSEYLQLEETVSDTTADLPSVQVYYKLAHPKNEPLKPTIDLLHGKLTAEDTKIGADKFSQGKTADAFQSKERTWQDLTSLKGSIGAAGNNYSLDAAYLTDLQWAEVLRNCGAMYGWIVDREKNKIIRAPKPAFQLRPKLSDDETHAIPDFIETAPVAKLPVLPQITEADMDTTRAKVGNWSSRTEMKGKLSDKWTGPKAVTSQAPAQAPAQAQTVTLDAAQQATDAAQTAQSSDPAADASKEEDTQAPIQATDAETTEPATTPAAAQEPQTAKPAGPTFDQLASNPALAHYVPRAEAGKAVYTVLPSFQVNDDSKIEITVSSHEFETSMAQNDFSNHSTEGSLSGGYGGFAATVSAGYSKEQSYSKKVTTNTYKKTMIAKFLLPRADIFLHPNDLEPTPELKAALERIRKNKNIADLRKLNQDFGQLWCQRVTVGGRLQSQSIMTETTNKSEQEQKDAFKVSVGVQVTTPFVGVGVKHTNENGKQKTQNAADIKKDETHVFEAVGGDTILAASPDKWSSTVADYRTWRIIDRDSLSSLSDAISAIPGYGQVRHWFMQAVPTLSKYIELPPSREINLRFKLTAPTSQLSLSYVKKTESYDASGDPIYYLGHSTGADVRPVKNELTLSNNVLAQCDIIDAKPLFSPQSYRAPVLLGYSSNLVGDSAYGSQYSQAYTNSLWKVSAPFNDALVHGVLVCLSTVPIPKPAVTANAAASTAPEAPLSLVVFRNQQSVFLPGLSDAPERHYWRILKHGARSRGEHIREGDDIYFAWAAQNQTAGFRDFAQDVFGRRRLQLPDDMKGRVLYMKLPWPRFEPLAKPAGGAAAAVANTMMLTDDPPAVNNAPQRAAIKTAPGMAAAAQALSQGRTATDLSVFGLQDVRFRVDVVGNDGRGDVGDHLLRDLKEDAVTKAPDAIDVNDDVIKRLQAGEARLKHYESLFFLKK